MNAIGKSFLHIHLRVIPFTIFFVIGVSLFYPVESPGEFQITNDPWNQYDPSIYGDIVIWQDYRNGNSDIYGYNLQTQEEFPICVDPNGQVDPEIHGNIVVWEDLRSGTTDIYGFNLETHKEFQITKDQRKNSDPAIYENIVVWSYREDIHGFNLLTGEEFQITNNPRQQNNPEIYNNIVVWEDTRDLGSIYGYNLETCQEFPVVTELFHCFPYPVIYKDTIIWGYVYPDSRVIDVYDLSESKKFRIYRDFFMRDAPGAFIDDKLAVYEDIVIWSDYRNDNHDIYGYNVKTHQEFQITTDPYNQYNPAFYGDYVVWIDERNGNPDVYGFNLLSPVQPVFFSYRTKVILLFLFCVVLAALPTVIGVYRERKEAASGRYTSPGKMAPLKTRDFRRSSTLSILLILAAVPVFLIGFYIILDILTALYTMLLGIVLIVNSGYYGYYYAFLLKKYPYVRITDEAIAIFSISGILRDKKRIDFVRWSSINNIKFKGNTVLLWSPSGGMFKIHLFLVDRRDKKDLIEILKNPPREELLSQ